jgi:hypothetical protein
VVETDKAARDFTAYIFAAYKLSTSKIALLDLNNDLPGLGLLKHKQRLRKLWQGTKDPACKTAVNWVSKAIRRMTRKRALERWETKIVVDTLHAIWPLTKSLLMRDGPRAPTAIHGASGLKFHPSEKADAITDSLELQFTAHDLCDEARVEALLKDVVYGPTQSIRSCFSQKLMNSLKLRKARGILGIPNE